MKKCKLCGHILHQYSTKYYCCDKQEVYCSFCSRKKCPKCLKSPSLILRSPQCGNCYNRVDEEIGFQDKTCGKYFCSRCLVKSFKQIYSESSNIDPFYYNDLKKPVKLLCGHQCQFNVLQDYFRKFCVDCGKQYRQAIDYELKDGVKLCFSCHSLFKDKYKKCLISCVSCGRQIDNHLKASIADGQGLILCQQCVYQSQVQEIQLEKSRKLNDSRKLQESKYKEKLFQRTQQISNKKVSQNLKDEKPQQKKEEKVSSVIEQKIQSLKKEKYHIDQKKQEVKQQQPEIKESAIFQNPNKQSYPVINKIIEQMQEGNEEMRKSLGLQKKPLLKKHLSDETRVEKLQLEIKPNKVQEFTACKQCRVKVSTKIAYNLKPTSSSKIKSSNFLCISSVESFRPDKFQNQLICRVCYLKIVNEEKKKKKDLASQTKIYQENSLLNESKRSNESTRVESAIKRTNRSLYSQSPYKGYGLTGARIEQPSSIQRNHSVRKQQRQIDRYGAFKQEPQRLRASSNYFTNRLQQKQEPAKKCLMCGSSNKKLAMSSTRSFYCMDCLYMYRPFGQSRNTKLIY